MKFPCQDVCELVFGVDIFDLDFGVQINSIEQPIKRATLCVLETCLIVGLLPFLIILITASLSSNTYNKASWRADWTFQGTESMSFITSIYWEICSVYFHHSQVSPFDLKYEKYFQETIRSHNSRAGKPSNLSPVSREMSSDSVEL